MASVTIPPVRTFAHVEADKAQALKVVEEASEVFGAWQSTHLPEDRRREQILFECADVIQATCNLLAALDVTDMTEAMAACERRNRERGRYGDR